MVSLATGILSLLPYFPELVAALYNAFSPVDIWFPISASIPVAVYASAGLVFGTISLIVGSKAHKQIRKSENAEKGHGIATAGMILGALGLIMNVFYGILFVLIFKVGL